MNLWGAWYQLCHMLMLRSRSWSQPGSPVACLVNWSTLNLAITYCFCCVCLICLAGSIAHFAVFQGASRMFADTTIASSTTTRLPFLGRPGLLNCGNQTWTYKFYLPGCWENIINFGMHIYIYSLFIMFIAAGKVSSWVPFSHIPWSFEKSWARSIAALCFIFCCFRCSARVDLGANGNSLIDLFTSQTTHCHDICRWRTLSFCFTLDQNICHC